MTSKANEIQANNNVEIQKKLVEQLQIDIAKIESRDEKGVAFARLQAIAVDLATKTFLVEDAVIDSVVAAQKMRILCCAALGALEKILKRNHTEVPIDTTIDISLKDNMTRSKKPVVIVPGSRMATPATALDIPLYNNKTNLNNDLDSNQTLLDNHLIDSTDIPPIDDPDHETDKIETTETPLEVGDPELEILNLRMSWSEWKDKIENIVQELDFICLELEVLRDDNKIIWKEKLKEVAPPSQLQNEEAPQADVEEITEKSVSEKKMAAKKKKEEARKRREEKKLQESLRASAEDNEGSNNEKQSDTTRKKLKNRVFEAIRRVQCLDNIMSSPHGCISLNVAGTGNIGIFDALRPLLTEKEKAKTKMKKSTLPDGVQVFDWQCDRNKWVHVAIVCTKLPKDRIVLYLDGVPCETLNDASFNFPMKYFGLFAQFVL